jgi:hypothetical protein
LAFTRLDLENKIKELFDMPKLTPLIDNQITKLVREKRYSYQDIARALYFWRMEENQMLDNRGIAIVPYIMDRAIAFFNEKAKQQQEQLEQAEKYVVPVTVIKKPIRRKIQTKQIDITSIKEDTDGRR